MTGERLGRWLRGLALGLVRRWRRRVKCRIGSHVMVLDARDPGLSLQLGKAAERGEEREAEFMRIIRRELQRNSVAVDIGANIGYVSLVMAEQVGPGGRVVAFEPHPRNCRLLRRNVALNGYRDRIEVHPLAISNCRGRTRLYTSSESNLHGLAPSRNTRGWIRVQTTSLDEFFRDRDAPHFVKMDIEGHEVEALEGMTELVENTAGKMKLLLEVHPMYYSGERSLDRQLRRFLSAGFRVRYVVSAGVPHPSFFRERGYEPAEIVETDGYVRGIYVDVSEEDMLAAACRMHGDAGHPIKVVRSIMIER